VPLPQIFPVIGKHPQAKADYCVNDRQPVLVSLNRLGFIVVLVIGVVALTVTMRMIR